MGHLRPQAQQKLMLTRGSPLERGTCGGRRRRCEYSSEPGRIREGEPGLLLPPPLASAREGRSCRDQASSRPFPSSNPPSLHHPQLRSRRDEVGGEQLLREAVRGSRAAAGGEEGERAPPAVRIGAFLLLNELLSAVPSDSKSGAVEISSEFVVWLGPARAEQQAWLWWESGRGAAAPGCLAGRGVYLVSWLPRNGDGKESLLYHVGFLVRSCVERATFLCSLLR